MSLDAGEPCFVCNEHDFLPFTCDACGKQLCREHAPATAHPCTADRVATAEDVARMPRGQTLDALHNATMARQEAERAGERRTREQQQAAAGQRLGGAHALGSAHPPGFHKNRRLQFGRAEQQDGYLKTVAVFAQKSQQQQQQQHPATTMIGPLWVDVTRTASIGAVIEFALEILEKHENCEQQTQQQQQTQQHVFSIRSTSTDIRDRNSFDVTRLDSLADPFVEDLNIIYVTSSTAAGPSDVEAVFKSGLFEKHNFHLAFISSNRARARQQQQQQQNQQQEQQQAGGGAAAAAEPPSAEEQQQQQQEQPGQELPAPEKKLVELRWLKSTSASRPLIIGDGQQPIALVCFSPLVPQPQLQQEGQLILVPGPDTLGFTLRVNSTWITGRILDTLLATAARSGIVPSTMPPADVQQLRLYSLCSSSSSSSSSSASSLRELDLNSRLPFTVGVSPAGALALAPAGAQLHPALVAEASEFLLLIREKKVPKPLMGRTMASCSVQ